MPQRAVNARRGSMPSVFSKHAEEDSYNKTDILAVFRHVVAAPPRVPKRPLQDQADSGPAPRSSKRKKRKKHSKLGRNEWRPAKYKKAFSADQPCCKRRCFERFQEQVEGWRKAVCENKTITPRQKVQKAVYVHETDMKLATGMLMFIVTQLSTE